MSEKKGLQIQGGFYKRSISARRQELVDALDLGGLDQDRLYQRLSLDDPMADRMVENALGVFGMPFGVCLNMVLDGEEFAVPMAVEEPSVIAAASHASKMIAAGGGITTHADAPLMIGQVQLLEVPDPEAAASKILAEKDRLLAAANRLDPRLVAVGGGARDLEVRQLPPMESDDPLGHMVIVHLIVDVQDAMGANAINTMCEALAPELSVLSGGRSRLRILSNLSDKRTVSVRGVVPFSALKTPKDSTPEQVAKGIEEASVFAERDPYRAATHNKGIMNGIDAVLIAFGQDWRAVEAGAHAFAARDGRYRALAKWRVQGETLVGEMTLPMAVGIVGGVARVHPKALLSKSISRVNSAMDLAKITAAVGLAQNLGALRALAAEGIQRGHMRLHARNVAAEAGAEAEEINLVAERIADQGTIHAEAAKEALLSVRAERTSLETKKDSPTPSFNATDRFSKLLEAHGDDLLAFIRQVVKDVTPETTLESMLDYHMGTGGKRLRALLPMLVAERLGLPATRLLPFGAACEMLHNATLVHDDLQDGDALRRGQKTIWAEYGMPQAVNLGDAMFYYTVLLAQELDFDPVARERAVARIMRETLRIIDGQEKEFSLKLVEQPTEADYLAIVEGKTSGLFSLPIAGAAELCGADPQLIAAAEEAARHMGVLFQIQDDVLDIYGEKGRDRVGSDIAEGKRSLLVVYALQHSQGETHDRLRAIIDKAREETTDAEIAEATALFETTGAKAYALAELAKRHQEAVDLVKDTPLEALVDGMCALFLRPIQPLLG